MTALGKGHRYIIESTVRIVSQRKFEITTRLMFRIQHDRYRRLFNCRVERSDYFEIILACPQS